MAAEELIDMITKDHKTINWEEILGHLMMSEERIFVLVINL